MIKRKVKAKKVKTKKRKNPELESEVQETLSQFGKNIKFKYLAEGTNAETYYFVIKDSDKLNPGEYVIKLFFRSHLYMDDRVYLKKLSKYGLIPKIYYIDGNFIIMKYIKGEPLSSIIYHLDNNKIISSLFSTVDLNIILNNLKKLINKWHELGFTHGDLNLGNILVTNSKNVYLIDPDLDTRLEIFDKHKKSDNNVVNKLIERVNL